MNIEYRIGVRSSGRMSLEGDNDVEYRSWQMEFGVWSLTDRGIDTGGNVISYDGFITSCRLCVSR